jgi:CHAD domain-containing protein
MAHQTGTAGYARRMAVSVNETETKYEATADAVVPSLAALPGVAASRGPQEQQLDAEYYDTQDLRLLRAGITLRRRRGGSDAGWHLKLPVGPVAPDSREEIRLQLGHTGHRVPHELADLVRARTRGAPLVRVATISTLRQATTLVGDRGESLAEVADDSVTAVTAPDHQPAAQWREIEVELTGGGRELLAAADKLLRREGLQRSARSAKLERVLSDRPRGLPHRGAVSPRKLTSSSTAGDVVRAYLSAQVEAVLAVDPKVRRAEPDSVHQMRVATRRLRSTLRSFGTVVSRADTEHLADELQWLGGVLGEARDAEVQAGRLDQHVQQTETEQLLGPVQARIQAYSDNTRAESLAAVAAALRSARYDALLDGLDQLIADAPAGDEASVPARQALPAAALRSYGKTRRRMRAALRASAGREQEAAFHRARKGAKQTRYAAEAVSPVLGRDANKLARRMKKLQSVLGDHQDTVVGRRIARKLGVAADQAGESAFSYGLFYGRDACKGAQLQERAAKAWKKASRAGNCGWMARRSA